MPRPRFNQSGIRHSLRYGAAPKAQNGIEESQRKQSPEEDQCKEMPKTGQRKTTGDRSMQGSTGMLRPRFNQSGTRHSLRSGAAPKAQNGIEESQCHKNPVQANAKQPLPKPAKTGLHKRETPSVNLPRPACSRRSHATWKSGRTYLPARPNRNG